MRKIFAVAMAIGLTISLGGCSANDDLANQFRSGDNKQYIAGDGTVTEFQDPSARLSAKAWAGYTESGATITDQDLVGQVVVLNFWYAGCAPCRAEAPDLQTIKDEFAKDGVQVLGVNVRDTAETSLAFAQNLGLDFPSVIDAQSGNVLLAFTGIVTPQAVPTTIVQDRSGKVSARILGRFDLSTLRALVKTALKE